jgi:hypothetical protein
MKNQVESAGHPKVDTFKKFKALVNKKVGRYYTDYRFASADTVFSCQLWQVIDAYRDEDQPVIVPDITITYSLSTGKWYLHSTFDGFSISEGNSLEEVLPGYKATAEN